MSMDRWEGCYDDNWIDSIVPEAFSHPAKFSRGLIHRIYRHAKDEGWVKPGDMVLDPFGGVALGGLEAMANGLNWVGVELEQKFVDLGKQNIALWQRQLKGWPNLGTARIVQGDSRRIGEVVEGAGLVVSSPPFSSIIGVDTTMKYDKRPNGRSFGAGKSMLNDYGHTPGNLANMKEGVSVVVGSPPYEGSIDHAPGNKNWKGKMQGNIAQVAYGETKQNLGNSSGDTFWSSSREIVQGCYSLLKPNGHATWVCKDYVKAGKRVPFSDRWQALCESVGFKVVCRHHAMLVANHGAQMNITGEMEEISVERKSFFRRLAEKKGSPRIDHEDVICMVKE